MTLQEHNRGSEARSTVFFCNDSTRVSALLLGYNDSSSLFVALSLQTHRSLHNKNRVRVNKTTFLKIYDTIGYTDVCKKSLGVVFGGRTALMKVVPRVARNH